MLQCRLGVNPTRGSGAARRRRPGNVFRRALGTIERRDIP